jgi:transcriptional regulator with XRE-family HTH domain
LLCTAHRHPIRLAREARGLTQRDLGALAGIHHTKISFFENGLRPRVDELARMAEALGVSPDALVIRGRSEAANV